MVRSLVGLSGRRRVAGALGVGVLAGSLVLAGCSSGSPKGGGTIPPLKTAGASGAASAGAVTAESLSDPDLGYTVASIPKDLDAAQTKVLQDYVAYDKATWHLWFTREGLEEALARSTGTTREDIQRSYEKMTAYDTPPVKVGVGGVDISQDEQSVDVTVCSDRTQMRATDFQGNDVTQKSTQNRVALLVRMVPRGDGVWVTQSETKISMNECTAESGK